MYIFFLAADAISAVAKDSRSHRACHKAHGVNGEGLQGTDQRFRLREIELGEYQPGHHAVEEEVVPFDGSADGAGDDRSPQLAAVFGIGS